MVAVCCAPSAQRGCCVATNVLMTKTLERASQPRESGCACTGPAAGGNHAAA